MANDLNAQKGTYVASDWKDGVEDFTPITPDRLNHIEKGIQSNSEDLKTLGNAWDSASSTIFKGSSTLATDMNDLIYGIHTFVDSTKNIPASGVNGMVLCIGNSNGSRRHQLAFSLNGAALYQRAYNDGWKNWRTL